LHVKSCDSVCMSSHVTGFACQVIWQVHVKSGGSCMPSHACQVWWQCHTL